MYNNSIDRSNHKTINNKIIEIKLKSFDAYILRRAFAIRLPVLLLLTYFSFFCGFFSLSLSFSLPLSLCKRPPFVYEMRIKKHRSKGSRGGQRGRKKTVALAVPLTWNANEIVAITRDISSYRFDSRYYIT